MILLIGIIFSLVFMAVTLKKGLYVGWVRLVNVVLAIYMSVFLTPGVSRSSDYITESHYGYPVCMIIIAAAMLVILHAFTTTFLTGILKITFPKILNIAGSAMLGFLCGLLVWSYLCFVLLLTPLPHNSIGRTFNVPAQLVRSSVPPLRYTCGIVNFLSFQPDKANAAKVLDSLLYVEDEKAPHRHKEPVEEEQPADVNEATHDDKPV
jgi:hypothetical protein